MQLHHGTCSCIYGNNMIQVCFSFTWEWRFCIFTFPSKHNSIKSSSHQLFYPFSKDLFAVTLVWTIAWMPAIIGKREIKQLNNKEYARVCMRWLTLFNMQSTIYSLADWHFRVWRLLQWKWSLINSVVLKTAENEKSNSAKSNILINLTAVWIQVLCK